jgi:hypothetical protein
MCIFVARGGTTTLCSAPVEVRVVGVPMEVSALGGTPAAGRAEGPSWRCGRQDEP